MRSSAAIAIVALIALLGCARESASSGFAPPPGGARGTRDPGSRGPKVEGGVRVIEDTEPLECTPDCLDLRAEVARQCGYKGTNVNRTTQGPYTIIVASTDPTSFLFTSSTYVFDRAGKLVGRTTFVNEYSRTSRQGIVPLSTTDPGTDACVHFGERK